MFQAEKRDVFIGGNIQDKYTSLNPIVKLLMSRFKSDLLRCVKKVRPTTIHEVGCGEGYLTRFLASNGFHLSASDVSPEIISCARRLDAESNHGTPKINYEVGSVYNLADAGSRYNLVICCEVLEHLESPEKGLEQLAKVAAPYAIISVPREPLWRFLNMCRGKYWSAFGNTPGHLQHWSKGKFIRFAERHFDVVHVETPLPWTMLLLKLKDAG